MGRPFIEFIQSQQLPWVEKSYVTKIRPGVLVRELSLDTESGGCSLLLKYPENYVHADSHILNADEEFFVIDGEITIDGQKYGRYNYGHFLRVITPLKFQAKAQLF